MDDDFKIIESPLSTSITQNGITIEVHICRGEKDGKHAPAAVLLRSIWASSFSHS
jgi:hypothetical protein